MKKNILILGSGGREHALVWSFVNDSQVGKVYCAPGNGGTAKIAENINLNLSNHLEIIRIVQEKKIDMTVVGPEAPLAQGIVDIFKAEGLKIFGPDAYGAQLESSKLFARDLMAEKKIPHPDYYSCSSIEEAESLKAIIGLPLVLKADGLASGKGVFICKDDKSFKKGLEILFESDQFTQSSSRVSLERCLEGEELSVFAVCDGNNYKIIGCAQDHKRAFEGDKGPNTGGMGAYSPTILATEKLLNRVGSEIIQPTLEVMVERGYPYTGFLYVGLMLVKGEPFVIEYNVRMGDPETQVVLPLLKTSLFDILWNATEKKLDQIHIKLSSETAVTVVMAASGYPGEYNKGMRIKGLDSLGDRLIFHAGTRRDSHDILSTGGRILNAVGFGKELKYAISDAYDIVNKIDYNDKYYRKDIGKRGMQYIKRGKL